MRTRRHWVGAGCGVLSVVATAALAVLAARAGTKPPAAAKIETGVVKSLQGVRLFPDDDPWNKDISKEPVDPNSDALVASIGLNKKFHPDWGSKLGDQPWGIPYVVVSGDQPKVPVRFEYKDESDPGPYPVPPDAPIEGGPNAKGDRHVLVLDKDNWKLYELFSSYPEAGGKSWRASSGAIFDLTKNSVQRPKGWTSADAAGLSVMAGLVRYDEVVEQKALRHAVRFTCVKSRHAYVYPATHFASNKTDKNLPPMGMRVRLKASYDTAKFPPTARVILEGLKTYGMILADNGGDWFVTGAPTRGGRTTRSKPSSG